MKKINAPKPKKIEFSNKKSPVKKIQFSKKKAALHKMLEALIKEDNDTAAIELHNYLQAKSREILGEETEEDEDDEDKDDEKSEEKEDDEDDKEEKKEVDESYTGPGHYGVRTKTGTFHVKADSKSHAQELAQQKAKKHEIEEIFFDKGKTKQSEAGKKKAH